MPKLYYKLAMSPRASEVMAMAQKEALRDGGDYVTSEHVLCGILRMGRGYAYKVLRHHGVTLRGIRKCLPKLGIGK